MYKMNKSLYKPFLKRARKVMLFSVNLKVFFAFLLQKP